MSCSMGGLCCRKDPCIYHQQQAEPDPAEVEALRAEVKRMKAAASTINEEVCQTLGKVLGYPWFKDDLGNFPGSTEAHGVCVGDHVAESIAAEAAERIEALRADAQLMAMALAGWTPDGNTQDGAQATATQAEIDAAVARHLPARAALGDTP